MSKESTPHGHCAAALLVRNRVGAVAACPDCGQLQLMLEYLTLRFEPEAFRELTRLLASAQQRLDHECATGGEDAASLSVVH